MSFTIPQVRSWRTTVTGLIAAAASFVVFGHNAHYFTAPGWMLAAAGFMQVGGLASFGIAAKDAQVSGDPPHEIKEPSVDGTSGLIAIPGGKK